MSKVCCSPHGHLAVNRKMKCFYKVCINFDNSLTLEHCLKVTFLQYLDNPKLKAGNAPGFIKRKYAFL